MQRTEGLRERNKLSSTSMKLRKSLVKPVTRQNISSCSVLSPEIVTHDAFNVILWTSADIYVRSWRSRVKEPNNSIYSAVSLALQVIFVRRKRPQIYASDMTISGERTEQHVVIGFGELAAVD